MSLISESDFYMRKDTCQGPVTRLLFVGAITPRKGVEYLLEACHQLSKMGIPFELQIVGSGDAAMSFN